MIICKLTKYGHFIALQHPFTAIAVAKAFFDTIFKFHGLPVTIIIDKDKIFTSIFWKDLYKAMGTKLAYIARHIILNLMVNLRD